MAMAIRRSHRGLAIALVLAVIAAGGALSVASASGAGEAAYVAITPERLLDTRAGFQVGEYASPWEADTTRSLVVTGVAGVPADNVDSVVLNVTTVAPSAANSFLTIYPTGESRPTTSALNFVEGEIGNDVVIAGVGANGSVDIYNAAGSVDLVIDVAGYYTTTLESRVTALESQGGTSGGAVTMMKTMVGVLNVGNFDCAYQAWEDAYGCGEFPESYVNELAGAGFYVDATYFPAGATGKLYIAGQVASANTEVCFRLRDVSQAAVSGSEVCVTTGSTPLITSTPSLGQPYLIETGPFTLAPGTYLVQSKVDGAGEPNPFSGGTPFIGAGGEATLALVRN